MVNKLIITILFLFPLLTQAQDISIVKVFNGEGYGTGFSAYSNDNKSIIITNQHVCVTNYDNIVKYKKDKYFKYVQSLDIIIDPITTVKGNILAVAPHYDLCFIVVNTLVKAKSPLKRFKIVYNEELRILGTPPFGESKGTFIGEDKGLDAYSPWHIGSLMVKGSFRGGQSGSPVVNSKGEIVGVFWGTNSSRNEGFFMGADAAWYFLQRSLDYFSGVIVEME